MDLLWFFVQQFKVPIIGLIVLGFYIWLRVFRRPLRRVMPQEITEDQPGRGEKKT